MILTEKVRVTIDSTLLKKVLAIDENITGEMCVAVFEEYQKQFEDQLPDNILILISYYSSSSDLFEFLHTLTTEDVDNLKEGVNDYDETLIDAAVIFEFSVVKTFVDCMYAAIDVQQRNNSLHLQHMVACIENIWGINPFDDLLQCIESSSLALSCIRRVHVELTDKEQAKRRRIADILDNSTIRFVRTGRFETTFDVNVILPKEKTTGKDKKILFSDLSELRDRVRLLEYSSNVNRRNIPKVESEHEKIKLRYFIHFANVIDSTLENLITLYTTGYPDIAQFIAPQKEFVCIDGIFNELTDNSTYLKNLLDSWKDKLYTMYEVYHDLTYFTGDQFWLIEDYIYNQSSLSHPGYHLLRYVDIDSNSMDRPVERPTAPEDRLANLGHLLIEQRQKFPATKETLSVKKCLLVETTNEGILRAILSLSSKTKNPVRVHHLLFCTLNTNWIQVQALIYRCFYSQTFHLLIHPELLSQSIQDQFIRLLRILREKKPDYHFPLAFITTVTPTNQQLICGIQSMDMLVILRDQDLLNREQLQESIRPLIRNYQLVTSRITGLGKSTLIRQQIEQAEKKYVKFPLHGDFNIDTLAKRLREKFSELQIGALHLDIVSSDNNRQLNEMLFCLLLFGSFRFGEEAVSIPDNTPIYIELDASSDSILTHIPLFQHIESSQYIHRVEWNDLNIKTTEIQAVANYLQAIADKTIATKDITPSMIVQLDLATCIRRIQEPFLPDKNPDYITWTQLSIFIAVFNRLFTNFSVCPYFSVEYTQFPQLRMDLVRTLLQSSNQFTSRSVEAVRQHQRSAGLNQSVNFSDHITQWEQTEPFTMIFTDTADPLFVYKKSSDIPPTLVAHFTRYYRAIGRLDRLTVNEMFPEYNTLTHAEFFIKLASLSKKYFNKSICIKCYRQYESTTEKCQECSTKDRLIRSVSSENDDIIQFQIGIANRLQTSYVLTPDNYIKMLLIYMRVLSGIPVLIMGETGNRFFCKGSIC